MYIDASGYNRTYAQTLGTINAARTAHGLPAFGAPSARCRMVAAATGSSLDGGQGGYVQHQNVVYYGGTVAASYAPDAAWPLSAGTLTVYQC